MQSEDVPALEAQIKEFKDLSNRLREDVRKMAISMTHMSHTCQGEPELVSLLEKEGRRLAALRDLLESDNLTRQMSRRLPRIASKLQEEARTHQSETAQVREHAAQVHQSLTDILQSFLRGGN